MKERPILFSTAMVQAILTGKKTQTRRVVKPQPSPAPARIKNWGENFGWMPEIPSGKVGIFQPHSYRCPYGEDGDFLWVRESFNIDYFGQYVYKADDIDGIFSEWKPSIHMPYIACRLKLEIIEIRIERLQDIKLNDLEAEGIVPAESCSVDEALELFKTLWQTINGAESWDANPFVWVIEFKRL